MIKAGRTDYGVISIGEDTLYDTLYMPSAWFD